MVEVELSGCSVDSNHNEVAGKLLKVMLDSMVPSHSPSPEPGSTHSGSSPVKTTPQPISLETLNSLAMHAKIRLMEMIKMHLIKVVEAKNLDRQVTPALLETYSRLLVRLGTRNFQCESLSWEGRGGAGCDLLEPVAAVLGGEGLGVIYWSQ